MIGLYALIIAAVLGIIYLWGIPKIIDLLYDAITFLFNKGLDRHEKKRNNEKNDGMRN